MPGISARPKLLEPTGFATPERAELALAIAAREAAEQTAAALRKAEGNLFSARTEANEAVDAAKASLQVAQAAAVDHMVAEASGGLAAVPSGTREARLALQEAEDRHAAARAALASIGDRIAQAAADSQSAATRVQDAAAAVLRTSPATRAAVATVIQLQDQVLRHGSLLLWLIERGVLLPRNSYGHAIGEDKEASEAQRRMWQPPNHWPAAGGGVQLQRLSPDAHLWEAARTALLTDATASLPGEA